MLAQFFGRICLLWVMGLVGCGGGGDSSTAVPTITTQPVSQAVVEGASVTLSVVASGSSTLAYQWRKGGVAINSVTAATVIIAAVSAADAGDYDVVVSSADGSVTSAVATLTVSTATGAPTIGTQPVAQSVNTGASATFSVVASGTGTLAYQWYQDGAAVAGATASSYTIGTVATTHAGSYTVVVSNANGAVTSAAATLSVSTSTSTSGALSASVYTAAVAFNTTLSSTQKTTVQSTWSIDAARKWSNLPSTMVARNGVKWGDLSTAQKTAARTLIATALSTAGNDLHIGMQAADDYLAANGGGTSSYGAGYFYIAFIGTPSTTGFWMLQLTGHHLTYNIALNGAYKSPTPLFLAIEPRAAFTQSSVAFDPMSAQRTAIANLGAALTTYSAAKLSGTYGDLLFGANGSGNIDGSCASHTFSTYASQGVAYSSLSSSAQALVQAAITAYVNTQATEYADALLGSYLSASALASTYVSYTGDGTVTTQNNYFRIVGPRVWIEFSVPSGVIIQNDVHYHTIWRDRVADYGGNCVGS